MRLELVALFALPCMEGAARPGGRPISKDPVEEVWFSIAFPPCFVGLFLAISFAGRADGPAWELWARPSS
jgi:hypothetical protein